MAGQRDRMRLCASAALVVALVAGLAQSPVRAEVAPPRVDAGRVSGRIEALPLVDALAALQRGGAHFRYKVNDALRDAPVSGRFDRTPLRAALRALLAPFNYYLIGSKGGVERVRVTSRKGLKPILPPAPRIARRKDGKRARPEVVLPDGRRLADLSAPERRFVDGVAHGEAPPEEQAEAFYPEQALGSEWTGPPTSPDAVVGELPESEPVANLDGPAAADGTSAAELPRFDPRTVAGGPSAPPSR